MTFRDRRLNPSLRLRLGRWAIFATWGLLLACQIAMASVKDNIVEANRQVRTTTDYVKIQKISNLNLGINGKLLEPYKNFDDLAEIFKLSKSGSFFWQNLKKINFKILFFDQLTKEETKRYVKNPIRGKAFALYIPEKNVIVLKRNMPLFVAAYVVAHEGQHVQIHQASWFLSFQQRVDMLANELQKESEQNKNYGIESVEKEEICYGLWDLLTYLNEFLAYSHGAAFRADLEEKFPYLKAHWVQFKAANNVKADYDPQNILKDRVDLFRSYVWSGNNRRVLRAIDFTQKDPSFSKMILQSGVDISQLRDYLIFNVYP